MQFSSDIEMCIRNKWAIRTLSEPRKAEVIAFLHQFRLIWHKLKVMQGGFPDSEKFMKRIVY